MSGQPTNNPPSKQNLNNERSGSMNGAVGGNETQSQILHTLLPVVSELTNEQSHSVNGNMSGKVAKSQNLPTEIDNASENSVTSEGSNLMDFLDEGSSLYRAEPITPTNILTETENKINEASKPTEKDASKDSSPRGRSRTRKQNTNMNAKNKNQSTSRESIDRAVLPKGPKPRNSVSLESKVRVQSSLETLTQLKSTKRSDSKGSQTRKKSANPNSQGAGARLKTYTNQNKDNDDAH